MEQASREPEATGHHLREIVPVLSGGGTRYSCHIGILRALQEHRFRFPHMVGVSCGSIVAALYASGWPLDRIQRLGLETDMRQFRGLSITKLLRQGGLSDGNAFEQWMDRQLEGRCFADLSTDLHILATDIRAAGPVLFNREHTPNLPISRAIRYSMSIPLLFSFKIYEDHIMTDGVILAEDALHRDWSGRGVPIVCFRLKSNGHRKPADTSRYLPVLSYVYMLIETFMQAVSREYVHANYWHKTIVVDTGSISSVNFEMSPEQKRELYDIGYRTAMTVIPLKLGHLLE